MGLRHGTQERARKQVAGAGQQAHRDQAADAIRGATQIAQLLRTGKRPERLVNPKVWPRASARLAALGLHA
jgi:D-3-phosphoglycerate dehydrogenase